MYRHGVWPYGYGWYATGNGGAPQPVQPVPYVPVPQVMYFVPEVHYDLPAPPPRPPDPPRQTWGAGQQGPVWPVYYWY